MLNRKCTFLENSLCLNEHCKTGSVRHFVCTIIPSNYLELIQYENPNSTLKQSKDTNLYSCQDFKLGRAHLKKLRRVEEGAKNFGVFRVKNHDFTPKNYIVSNCGGRRENCWGSYWTDRNRANTENIRIGLVFVVLAQ
jgi:hypothetical protein